MRRNVGKTPLELIDYTKCHGEVGVDPITENMKVVVPIGGEIPDDIWNALPALQRDQLAPRVEEVPPPQEGAA